MRKHKWLSGILTGVLALTLLSGCGTGTTSKSVSGSGDSSETIKIGTNFEMTGNASSYGQGSLKNIRLAVEEINAKGGVLGKQLEIIEGDNKSEPSESANITTKLITNDKVIAIIGTAASSNAIAAAPIVNQNGIPMIAPSATASAVTVNENGKVNEFVFRTCMINPFQGKVMANFAIDTLKVKNAAVLIDNSQDYSKDLSKEFIAAFEGQGGKIVLNESYLSKDTDFRPVLTRVKQANPDILYLPGYYQECAMIIKQAREIGFDKPILGGDAWDSPTLVDVAGKAALNNTFFSNHYSVESDNQISKNFVKAYQTKYKELPDAIGAMGYDAVYLLADAITRAGSTDPVAIKDAIANTKEFAGISGKISFDQYHNPVKSAFVITYQDGVQKLNTIVEPK